MVSESLAMATRAARSLNLINPEGQLGRLDSMTLIDFALALETELGREIPAAALHPFGSLDEVAAMLDSLKPSGG